MQYAASLNIPGKYLAESFPLLAKLPFQRWKKEIQAVGHEEGRANLELIDMVRQEIEVRGEGAVPDCLAKLVLRLRKEGKEEIPLLSDLHLSYVPASLFGAGSDTTASTLCSAILGLVTHPEVLKAAQAELDEVIGRDRLPTLEDEVNLPYLQALCKETLRWRPVAVLGGTPHASTADDVYEGYRIPVGTTILTNSWAVNLNEAYYPQPHVYDPIRFLPQEELVKRGISHQPYRGEKQHPSSSGHSSFGWGRRICPGAGLAENSLFIALAKLLWSFDILPIEGKEYDIFAYTEGFNVRPQKFECVIKVRSESHREVLEKEVVEARKWLEKFMPFEE